MSEGTGTGERCDCGDCSCCLGRSCDYDDDAHAAMQLSGLFNLLPDGSWFRVILESADVMCAFRNYFDRICRVVSEDFCLPAG
jgi:hypothetical protein